MSAADTIRILLSHGRHSDEPRSEEEWKRIAARVAWSRETLDRWSAAMRAMDERCSAAVGRLGEEEFNRLFEEEQAKVDAIRALLDDAIEKDLWPKELYFRCV